jgi:hypothetical protein
MDRTPTITISGEPCHDLARLADVIRYIDPGCP